MTSTPQVPSSTISSSNFDDFNTGLQAAALESTKQALGLPQDLGFYRSMDPDFSKELDVFSARVLSVTNSLLNLAFPSDSLKDSRGRGKVKLEDEDDVMDSFQLLVVDTMDQLLERAVRSPQLSPANDIDIWCYRTSAWMIISAITKLQPLLLTPWVYQPPLR